MLTIWRHITSSIFRMSGCDTGGYCSDWEGVCRLYRKVGMNSGRSELYKVEMGVGLVQVTSIAMIGQNALQHSYITSSLQHPPDLCSGTTKMETPYSFRMSEHPFTVQCKKLKNNHQLGQFIIQLFSESFRYYCCSAALFV